jgi:probable F420-dependent oxidoreductase
MIRIAVQLHPQHGTMKDLCRAALQAEEVGVDIVYNWDHFYPLYGNPDGAHFECWTTLAAWAEMTSRIEIGPLVTCNSYRNPSLLADMARTVDHVSDGRLIFGIGSGWFRRDYDSYGYAFGNKGSRLDDLAANLPVIVDRFERLNPAPTRHIPILIAGTGPTKTLPLVARYADSWHAQFPSEPAELEPAVARLRECCEATGRDPASIEWGLGIEPQMLHHDLIKHADAYVALGFTQFTLGVNGPDFEVGQAVREWLDWRDAAND